MTALTLSFQGHTPGTQVDNPGRHADFLSILVRSTGNQILQPLPIRNDGGLTGLSLGLAAQIDFDLPVSSFELVLGCFATRGVVEVFDSSGGLMTSIAIDKSDRVRYVGESIKRLYINSPNNETNLLLMRVDVAEKNFGLQARFFDKAITLDQGLSDDVCAEVIYGETSILRAPDTEPQLAEGRAVIASIAFARYLDDPTRFAPRKRPTPAEMKDETIKKHWKLCEDAAKAGRLLKVGTCRHFVIWPIDQAGKAPVKNPKIKDPWPYDYASKITAKYGPFKSYGEPPGDNFHIFKYCGVP